MTVVGGGGIKFARWRKSRRFHKEYGKLTDHYRDLTDQKLQDLCASPMPPGLRFEKLKGHSDIYTIHIDGNYKASLEIENGNAFLRRVADHNEIDRCP